MQKLLNGVMKLGNLNFFVFTYKVVLGSFLYLHAEFEAWKRCPSSQACRRHGDRRGEKQLIKKTVQFYSYYSA